MTPGVTAFLDEATFTVSYVVRDPEGRACAIIDPVLGFDPASGRTDTASADAIIAHVAKEDLQTQWILETHVHADHLTAAPYLRDRLGGRIAIGARVHIMQESLGRLFGADAEFRRDGSQFDALFDDGDCFHIGQMRADVLHTPGHTPACLTYVIGDAAFVGDTLFTPDSGTARCDLPGGSAEAMWTSVQRLLALPDATRIFSGHDYMAPGRTTHAWESTVARQRAENIHFAGKSAADFVRLRNARDATLALPRLILPALQVNMRAGQMPPTEENGISYLKLPVNKL